MHFFLASAAVVVLLALGLSWLAGRERYRAMEQSLRSQLTEQASRGIGQCEVDPIRFMRRGRGGPPSPFDPTGRSGFPPDGSRRAGATTEVFVYNSDFISFDPRAPKISDEMRFKLLSGPSASTTYPAEDGPGVEVGIRVGGSGAACAFLVGRMPPRPGELRDQRISIGLLVIGVLAVGWIASIPVILRMRRQESLRQLIANATQDVAASLTALQGHLADLERAIVPDSPEHGHVRELSQEAQHLASLIRHLGEASEIGGQSNHTDHHEAVKT
jgi:hypothetical protein